MSFWSKAKAAVRRLIPRKRAPEVPPEPPVPPKKPPAPTKSLEDLADELYEIGTARAGSHGADSLEEISHGLGQRNARALLRNQLESSRAYIRGNVEPGRSRWYARAEWMDNHSDEPVSDIDRFFWYHPRRM